MSCDGAGRGARYHVNGKAKNAAILGESAKTVKPQVPTNETSALILTDLRPTTLARFFC